MDPAAWWPSHGTNLPSCFSAQACRVEPGEGSNGIQTYYWQTHGAELQSSLFTKVHPTQAKAAALKQSQNTGRCTFLRPARGEVHQPYFRHHRRGRATFYKHRHSGAGFQPGAAAVRVVEPFQSHTERQASGGYPEAMLPLRRSGNLPRWNWARAAGLEAGQAARWNQHYFTLLSSITNLQFLVACHWVVSYNS